jgi:hypothetical protein
VRSGERPELTLPAGSPFRNRPRARTSYSLRPVVTRTFNTTLEKFFTKPTHSPSKAIFVKRRVKPSASTGKRVSGDKEFPPETDATLRLPSQTRRGRLARCRCLTPAWSK